MPFITNLRKTSPNFLRVLLAIDLGATFALGLLPLAYYLYFRFWGWPHPYITHWGPLWGTAYGLLLFRIDLVLLIGLPITTVMLALISLALDRKAVSRWWLLLPIVQILWAILNYLPIALLND